MKKLPLVTGILAVLLLPLGLGASPAAAQMSMKSIGGGLSITQPSWPDGVELDNAMGLRLQADMGSVFEGWRLQPYVNYWTTGSIAAASLSMLGAELQYQFPIDEGWSAFAGGGLGFYRASIDLFGESLAAEYGVGVDLLGGLEKSFGATYSGFAQLRGTLGTEWDSLELSFGVNYGLGGE